MQRITAITPTVCWLMQVQPPALSGHETLADVVEAAQVVVGHQRVEKWLVFAADAIGAFLFKRHEPMFEQVLAWAPVRKPLMAVFPSVTPVCFASIFTGASPEAHGIRKSEKPVLQCDTLFDALVRAGKKVAIVAVKDSSIERIFRGRPLDYFAEPYDPQVTDRVLELLEDGSHDFIVAYQQQYDDLMHRTGPESPDAIQALQQHVEKLRPAGPDAIQILGGQPPGAGMDYRSRSASQPRHGEGHAWRRYSG